MGDFGYAVARLVEIALSFIGAMLSWLDKGSESVRVLSPNEIQWEPLPGPDAGIFWGGIRILKSVATHFLALATTRAGKSTTLRLFMQDALVDVVNPASNTRGLVYDPKREIHGILAGQGLSDFVVTLDPYSEFSYALDISADITDQRGARLLSVMLVPQRDSQDGSGHFERALRAIIETVVLALIDRKDSIGKSWSLRTVLNILEDETLLRAVASRHPKGKRDIEAFLDGTKDTALDLRAVTRNFLSDYADIASLWHHAETEGRTISIDQWLKTNRILILPAPQVSESDQYDAISQLNRLLFGMIASRLLLLPEARTLETPQRIYIVLDEFRFAGKLPGLTQLFCQGASKGVRIALGVLNLPGLQDALGKERASEIFDLCAVKAFFHPGDAETAEMMAAQFGTIRETVEQESYGSQGRTVTKVQVDRPVLLDSDFINLPLPCLDPENRATQDLTGYYIVPGAASSFQAFSSTLSMERLYGREPFVRPFAPGFDFRERPKDQQRLTPFTDEERNELLGTPRMPRLPKGSPVIGRLPSGSTSRLFQSPAGK